MIKIFTPSKDYIEGTQQFNRSDVILSILLYLVVVAILWGIGSLARTDVTYTTGFLASLFFVVVTIGLVFILLRLRKQKILSLSFNKSTTIKSLAIGVICCLAYTAFELLIPNNIRFGGVNDSRPMFIKLFNTLITMAFLEELVFRAYIGPRLYGCFKNKFLSILVVGFLFALAHSIPGAAAYQMNIFEFLTSDLWQMRQSLLLLTILHFLFHWFYSKYNNIFGPVLLHFFLDFSAYLF